MTADKTLLEIIADAYWEREERLLNLGLSLVYGNIIRKGAFRIGYRLYPTLIKTPFTLILYLEPLGVHLSRKELPGPEPSLKVEQLGRTLYLHAGGRIAGGYGTEVETEEAKELGAPEEFLSFLMAYTDREGNLRALGEQATSRVYKGIGGDWTATLQVRGKPGIEIPWLMWNSLEEKAHSLFPKPGKGLA